MTVCTDCDARSVYISNGGTDYNITFEYDQTKPYTIKVSARPLPTTEYSDIPQNNPTYPWSIVAPDGVTFSQIRFANPIPVNHEIIIYRCTNIDDGFSYFNPGFPVKASDLNDNFSILKDAIEENCSGLDWVNEHLGDNFWDKLENTIGCDEDWISDDEHIATTCALDQRFWNQPTETIYANLGPQYDFIDSDERVMTAAAIEKRYWNQPTETIYATFGAEFEFINSDERVMTAAAIEKRYWNQPTETIYATFGPEFDFIYSDERIMTAAAIEKRFWNNVNETTYTTNNWLQHAASPNSYIPTTGAVEQRLDDFYSREDFTNLIVTGVDQRSGQWDQYNTDDKHVPTTDAVVERHDTHYSDTPLGMGAVPLTRHGDHGGGGGGGGISEPDKENQRNYIQPGKFWVNTQTQRLAYWNDQGYWVHTGAMPANDNPPAYVNNEQPPIAEEGDLWFNTGDGLMYVYYAPDPSGSNQWVSIGGGGGSGGGGGGGTPGAIGSEAPIEHSYDVIDQKTTVKFRINSLTTLR